MTKATQIEIAAVLGLGMFLIFIHPTMVGMPAPDARKVPISALLALACALVTAIARPLACAFHEFHEAPAAIPCDRLALICTRLC